jgi:hypothetical protein
MSEKISYALRFFISAIVPAYLLFGFCMYGGSLPARRMDVRRVGAD